jgi:hypothetical protein
LLLSEYLPLTIRTITQRSNYKVIPKAGMLILSRPALPLLEPVGTAVPGKESLEIRGFQEFHFYQFLQPRHLAASIHIFHCYARIGGFRSKILVTGASFASF